MSDAAIIWLRKVKKSKLEMSKQEFRWLEWKKLGESDRRRVGRYVGERDRVDH